LISIGGSDIVDGNRMLTLGYLWQLMRKGVLQMIGNKSEDELKKWANNYINNKEPVLNSF